MIFLIPFVLLPIWIVNLIIMYQFKNGNEILGKNIKIFFTYLILIFIYEGLSHDLSSQAFGAMFIILHPIILLIYLLKNQKKFKKTTYNDNILDEDFKDKKAK